MTQKTKIISAVMFLCVMFSSGSSFAFECIGKNKKQNMIAIVERVNTNQTWLHVVDERTRMKGVFYAARGHLKALEEGDRIRIYYYCGSNVILSLKKMTPVEFNPDTSNRGYIHGGPDK